MSSEKLIKSRISSINETMKITNAMYLISSSKVKQARRNLENSKEYFLGMRRTIRSILRHSPQIDHEFFDERENKGKGKRKGYIIITADKGLAGAYNLSVIRKVEELIKDEENPALFVLGQVGRDYFLHERHHYDMSEDFHYSSQRPTLQRARNITTDMIDLFKNEEIDEVYMIYTRMISSLQSEPRVLQLLPMHYQHFEYRPGDASLEETSFYPSEPEVLSQVAPIYMHGLIFGALTESYCAEQNSRMAAMDNSTQSAKKIVADLSLQYNRVRQGRITQEITEIVGGASASGDNR